MSLLSRARKIAAAGVADDPFDLQAAFVSGFVAGVIVTTIIAAAVAAVLVR